MNWTSICWKGQADLTDPFNVSKLLQLNLAFSPHRLLQETTTLEGLRFKILHQKNDGLLHMNIMNCPLVPNFWAIPQKKKLCGPCFLTRSFRRAFSALVMSRSSIEYRRSLWNDQRETCAQRQIKSWGCKSRTLFQVPASFAQRLTATKWRSSAQNYFVNEMPQSRNRIVQTKIASTESLLGNHSTRLFLEADAVELEASIPC